MAKKKDDTPKTGGDAGFNESNTPRHKLLAMGQKVKTEASGPKTSA